MQFLVSDIMPTNTEGYLCVIDEMQNYKKQYFFLSLDSNFQITNLQVVDERFKPALGLDKYIQTSVNSESELIITRPYDNRIFSYLTADGSIHVKYYLDLGDKEFDLSPLTYPNNYETFFHKINKEVKYSFAGYYYEVNNYLCLKFASEIFFKEIFYNKTTGKIRAGFVRKTGSQNADFTIGCRNGSFVKQLFPENFVNDTAFIEFKSS